MRVADAWRRYCRACRVQPYVGQICDWQRREFDTANLDIGFRRSDQGATDRLRPARVRRLVEFLSFDPSKVLPPTPKRFEGEGAVEELEPWLMANQRAPSEVEREAMRQR